MKNSTILTLGITLVLNCYIISSQTIVVQDDQLSSNSMMISTTTSQSGDMKIEGSPFINEIYLPVIITTHEDKNLSARFNAVNGDMEIKDVKSGKIFVLNRNISDYEVKFTGIDKIYSIYQYLNEDGNMTSDFLIKLTTAPNLILLKKETIQILEEKVAKTTYEKGRPAMYKRTNDTYFIKIDNGEVKYLSIKKKDIAIEFPEHSQEILNFIKSNKLKTSNEEDLVKLIKYIETII